MGVWVAEKKGFKTMEEALAYIDEEVHPVGCRCTWGNHRLEKGGYRKEEDGTYTACIVVRD